MTARLRSASFSRSAGSLRLNAQVPSASQARLEDRLSPDTCVSGEDDYVGDNQIAPLRAARASLQLAIVRRILRNWNFPPIDDNGHGASPLLHRALDSLTIPCKLPPVLLDNLGRQDVVMQKAFLVLRN